MSSSLQRTRSLRKTERAPTARAQPPRPSPPAEPDRGDSPSRLPVKPPPPRTTSTLATASARSGSRPVSAILGRSASTSQRRNAAAQEPVKRESSSRYPPSSASNRPPARTRPTSAGSVTSASAAGAQPRAASAASRSSIIARGGTASTAAKAAPPPSTPPAAVASRPTQHPRLRPAFSTLQQHYSPAKNLAPKPLTSTFLVPPSPSKLPANVAASAETNKLQTELLQLHLLHREAAPVQAQWQASARDKLGRRFTQLGEASRALADTQRAGVERDNILALRRWGSSGKGLDEKIQLLGDILSGLWTLSEPGGRYGRAVRRFERWAHRVRDVEEARASSGSAAVHLQSQSALFIDELDAPWKDECSAITRRLRDWRSQLHEIDDLAPATSNDVDKDTSGGSSLERMLAGARSLAQDMLAELGAMEDMEREALAREGEWIERMNRDEAGGEGTEAGAMWRTV
ncbi:hypothetical protein HRG_005524 [Hirsutella rhossiliensis]|uniref:Uncharacterized protein n=1 Tax=Hirsutella rhossiliensis TaxID=111463 RepID=A0A9P8MZ69_9HYPO|nr:uncharacterized protein HRG_05524 [Hirsutella rhossiliensis]KAH0963014.1 hypothetical protein HRG_05524 [Hirsutella rhossiliensis]